MKIVLKSKGRGPLRISAVLDHFGSSYFAPGTSDTTLGRRIISLSTGRIGGQLVLPIVSPSLVNVTQFGWKLDILVNMVDLNLQN